ncbi:MAG TPA: hypothetical protein VFC67_06325 [Prolixibacteraceae bacterium]|nr:hypothetical protein [Prolixibacteraceae bacterium]
MKNITIVPLDDMSLKEINGGSQESYENGQAVGVLIRKWALLITIIVSL